MAESGVLIFPVGIFPKGGDQPCHIGRTAGTGIPLRSLWKIMTVGRRNAGNTGYHLQRVHIKEPLAVELHSCQNRIVKSPLHHISILTVHFIFQHFGSKKHKADGRTGLSISGISGQIIVHTERLSQHCGTDTSRDIHSPFRDAFPQSSAGLKQLSIILLSGKICHTGIEIDCPHRMPCGILLFPHGCTALLILCIRGIIAPYCPVTLLLFLLIKMRIHTT